MDIERYTALLRTMLGDYRFTHSVGVMKAAVRLAEMYGADVEKARVAGLLHDVTKELDKAGHFELFRLGNVRLTALEERSPKLWHAVSGAVYAEKKLDVTDSDIVLAIRYHTTGRAGMSLLEKTVYLADFISEDRSYPDVDVVRKLAEKSLDQAVFYTQSYSVRSLINKGKPVHPDSLACYNEAALAREDNNE